MRLKAGGNHRVASLGFTLFELLLAISLMLLLMGAVVFSVSTFQHGAALDEGLNQFEALLQFSRAEAANTGRRVQIQCFDRMSQGATEPELEIRVVWELDPIGQPGHFEELVEATPYIQGIPDLVRVKAVHTLDEDPSSATPEAGSTNANARAEAEVPFGAVRGGAPTQQLIPAYPPVSFYPDGSSDSVEFVLASPEDEDERRFALRLTGLTGSIHRRLLPKEASLSEPQKPRQNEISEDSDATEIPPEDQP